LAEGGAPIEDLYSKIIPRRLRQNSCVSVKHGSNLDVLLSMGFPQQRALKALASTGGRSVQLACDWLFSHLDDPFLDDPLPREYVLYLRPSGPLQNQLSHFWQQSRLTCGKNKAHNIFPHITLCQFFMCPDNKLVALCEALQSTVNQWRGIFPSPLPLELYTSTNFIGLFVEEQVAESLKKFAADFAVEAAAKAGGEAHIKPYLFKTYCLTNFFSVEMIYLPMFHCQTLRVMYPYTPQNDDELELVPGDFIFSSTVEQVSTSEGWVYGTSLGTGISGLLPENYVSPADESDTWVFHGSHSFFCTSPSEKGCKESKSLDGLLNIRCFENSKLGESAILSVICQPMQVLRSNILSRTPKRTLFVCRHGERMDVVFGKHWLSQCTDSKGRYVRSNLNMPAALPAWGGAHRDYEMDTPITVVGATQSKIVGEALLESNTTIDFVYCSPSLRCVQTAHEILRGMQQDGRISIRVEPGLFEWTKWVTGTSLPTWIPPTDLAAANLNVDTTYRPHIPISKLTVSEAYDTYISRSHQVTKDILAYCKNKGEKKYSVCGTCFHFGANLSVQIPYLGLCACEEHGDSGFWQLVDPPILPLTHGPNHSFSWRETLQQE
uniref:Ubiquitin associated and SH3 domain containing Bb n=1 Tax=Sinocyclocheilus rhinocerous TaxID=307959 RepID=A0A673K0D6_9TELE